MNARDEYKLIERMTAGDFDPDQPRDEDGKWTDTGASSNSSGPKYSGKTGKIKYMNTEFEIDNDGNITSGPKALLEGLKNPKEPGKGIKQGDVVIYSPKWRSPGEEKYLHVVLEERGPRLLIGTLNTKMSLGSTESVTREMVQSSGYNAGVSKDYEKYNDPE